MLTKGFELDEIMGSVYHKVPPFVKYYRLYADTTRPH